MYTPHSNTFSVAEQDVDDAELLSEQEKMIRRLQMIVQNSKLEADIARVRNVFVHPISALLESNI